MKAWMNTLNTTSFRIIVSVGLAAYMIITLTLAMVFLAWTPTPGQKWVLMGIAGSILTMMGFDVIQFASKRFSNTGYAAAKSGAAVVTPPSDAATSDGEPLPTVIPAAAAVPQPTAPATGIVVAGNGD